MYIIKIKKDTATWIIAICPYQSQALEYLKIQSEEIQKNATCFEIAIEDFPFIIIENTELNQDSKSYFEYCTVATLQTRIEELRQKKQGSQEFVNFKYYFIDEEYFQSFPRENYMIYLRHTVVTNAVLDEPYLISIFHEEIKKCVSNYNIDGLDKLFEQTKTIYTSKEEKEDLAMNGYNNLFWDMNYDHACSKLTTTGIQYLIPMVENMEILLNEKKEQHRSFAQHILLEQACKEEPQKATAVLKETVEAFENYLISQPEEKLEIHRLLAIAYSWMIKTDPKNALSFWEKAVLEIKKAIDFCPEKASWSLFFELIYTPFEEDKRINQAQEEAQKKCIADLKTLENKLGAVISYQVALAYQHLQEHLEWKEIENIFPVTIALHWAEKALAYTPNEITRIDLYECASFFNQIGSKTKRIDFLEKTISLYERAMKASADSALEIYFLANLWKEITEIYIEKQECKSADNAIEQAKLLYENHIEEIKSHPSANLHYAKFLEYCFTYQGKITKPTLAELKSVANEIEIQSEGFLSYPYLLLMRIALYEKNEQQAILELTKSLILHEICADSTFDTLFEEFKSSSFNELKVFLNETQSFIKEVNTDYYYDPKIKWEQLSTMSEDELRTYWEKRKEEIRNRPTFKTE